MPDTKQLPRFDIIGCNITRSNMPNAVQQARNNIDNKIGGYICFTNVHAVVMSHADESFHRALDSSYMTLADGKPVYWYAMLRGLRDVGHVPGPDFMPRFIGEEKNSDLRHYFYGSTDEVLTALTKNLRERFPNIKIAGYYSPPFRELAAEETDEIIDRIRDTRPDVIWIGLGAPKQEQWMLENSGKLNPALLMGVGAAFDFHAGTLKRCPNMVTRLGIEWLYRLLQEPRRLFKRYLVTNSLFIWYIFLDTMKRVVRAPDQ